MGYNDFAYALRACVCAIGTPLLDVRLYMMMSEEAMATPPTQEKTPAEENIAENSKYIYF